jgi:hypothetical protein
MEQDFLPKLFYISVTLYVVTSQEIVSAASVVRTLTLTKALNDTHEKLKNNFSLKRIIWTKYCLKNIFPPQFIAV